MIQIHNLLPHEASEIFMAIALFVATILVIRYTQKRVADLPAEEKKIGRPLYLTGFSMLVLGLASAAYVSHHLFELEVAGIIPPLLQVYWFLAILGAGMLAISAMMILGWEQYIAIPMSAVLLGGVFALLGNVLGIDVGVEPTAGMMATIVGIIAAFLFVLPMVLFGFLAYRTKMATTIAIAIMTPLYAIWPVGMAWLDVAVAGTVWELILTFLRLLGPALIVVAYYMPDIKISGELFGYAASYAALAMWFAVFLSPFIVIGEAAVVVNPIELVLLSSHG
ncbi:MAG: hypothetical protein KAQ65_04865, partial [Candidatus Thorarchaeota archaeon]|nr:hypothetical protein [Candidatus Thorarchaeota archaeon]